MNLKQNWTIILAVVLAIVMLSAALLLRPVRMREDLTISQFYDTTSQKPATTSQIYEPTSASYRQVDEIFTDKETESATQMSASETTVRASQKEVTTSQTKKLESKLMSKLDEVIKKTKESRTTTAASTTMSAAEFRRAGVIYYGGYRYTWYSEKVLPGKGLNIPGRHSDGNFVRDGDGYIVLASQDLPKGTVVQTPFGPGKVYDYCGVSGTIDVYVSW